MNSILIIRADERLFDTATVERLLKSETGFRDLRFEVPGGDVLEARYGEPSGRTIVRLSGDRDTISLNGDSDIALQAALTMQRNSDAPLRIFDTNYSFDLMLSDFRTVEELRVAIDVARLH